MIAFLLLFMPSAFAFETGELNSIEEATEVSHQDETAKKWYERVEFGGSIAGGLFVTDNDRSDYGNNPFLVQEILLEMEANPWENTKAVFELYPIWWPGFSDSPVTIGEAYVDFRNIFRNGQGEGLLNIKVGRINIPYGDEYLWQNYWSNPLITRGAAWWWGWDQGVEAYGKAGPVGWIFAVTNGSARRTLDDQGSKQFNAKLYGNPIGSLDLALSYISTGISNGYGSNSLFQGWHHLGAATPNGGSASGQMLELAAKYSFGTRAYLKAEAGTSLLNNYLPDTTNHVSYYLGEGLINYNERLYLVGRYSAIGTFADDGGYPISDGMSGNSPVFSSVKMFSRWAVGVGFRLNPSAILKAEYSMDRFDMAAGGIQVGNYRYFNALQAVVKF